MAAVEISEMQQDASNLDSPRITSQCITAPLEQGHQLKALFSTMLDAVLVADDQANYIDANPAAIALLGYTREELLEMSVKNIAAGAEDVDFLQVWAAFLSEGQYVGEYALRCKDGSAVQVELRAVANVLPGMHVSVMRDITDRKRQEAEVQSQKELLHTILDHIPVMVNLFDSSGNLVWINREWERVLGWTLEEAGQIDILQEFYPDENARKRVVNFIQEANTGWGDFSTHLRDGEVLDTSWATVRLSDGTTIGIGQDITERKQAEVDLLDSQERLHVALSRGNIGLWDWDIQGSKLTVSPQWKAQLGYDEAELGDEVAAWKRLLHPDDSAESIQQLRDILQSEADYYHNEYRLQNKQGDYHWILSQGTIFRRPDGEAYRLLGVHIDITEIKEAEAELKVSRAALQEAHDDLEKHVQDRTAELGKTNQALKVEIVERQMIFAALRETMSQLESAKEEAEKANAAKNEFLSRVSHELRTPLNAILGFGQLLARSELEKNDREAVNFILAGGNHLLGLINEVLDIARIEEGRLSISLEPIEVSLSIREVLDIVRPLAAPHQIDIVNEMDGEGEWFIKADHQRFRQILLNLLSNAIKYNQDAGQVIVSARIVKEETPYLRISIRDTGMGLTPDELKKIFTPFERLKAAQTGIEGTGIGLSLSKKLAEAMGGRIGVESTLHEGSIFWLDFLLTDNVLKAGPEDGSKDVIGKSADHRAADSGDTLLYIEDNPLNLKLLEKKFGRNPNIDLLTASGGLLGLEMARKHLPKLILLDLHLPDINGDQVLIELQADPETRAIPVVILSADAMPAQIERLKLAGAAAYLTKPLDLSQLLNVVENLLHSEKG